MTVPLLLNFYITVLTAAYNIQESCLLVLKNIKILLKAKYITLHHVKSISMEIMKQSFLQILNMKVALIKHLQYFLNIFF